MNRSVLNSVLLAAFISNCTMEAKEKNRVEGTYVGQSENEFRLLKDTVIIEVYNEAAGTFTITHKKGYQRTVDGALGNKEYKKDSSVGVWDSEYRQIREQRQGRIYSFPATGNELLFGSTRYQKME